MTEFIRNWVRSKPKMWLKHMSELKEKEELKYLEIGVFEGRMICWLFNNLFLGKNPKAFGIDPFIYSSRKLTKESEEIKRRCLENTKEFNFRLIEGTSQEVLLARQERWRLYFDIIYVDGRHNTMSAYCDAVLSWPLLKKGGFMVFDDYGLDTEKFGRDMCDTPKRGVDFFLSEHDHELLWKTGQVGVRKL